MERRLRRRSHRWLDGTTRGGVGRLGRLNLIHTALCRLRASATMWGGSTGGCLPPRTCTPPRSIAANTISHTTSATHTQARAKLVIALAWAAWPTAKLHAAYMPTGNTVDQRRTS